MTHIKTETYDKDYYQWTIEQTQALRELINNHQELKNLIDEAQTGSRMAGYIFRRS